MYVKKPEVIRDIKDKSKKRWVLKPSFFDSPQRINTQQIIPIMENIRIELIFLDPWFIISGIIFDY